MQEGQGKAPEKQEGLVWTVGSLVVLVAIVFGFKDTILDANNIPTGSMIPTLKIGDYLFVNKMRYSIRIPFVGKEIIHIDDPQRGDIITFIPPGSTDKHYVKRVNGMPGDRIRIRNIPACRLPEVVGLKADPNLKREYSCTGKSVFGEPMVALVEYKENDAGPWKNYGPHELPAEDARRILADADNARVLHPDQLPPGRDKSRLPVLFEETIGGKHHIFTETNEPFMAHSLCADIETDGCVIPAGAYLAMGDNRDDSQDSRIIGYINRERIRGKAVIIYFSINWRDDICENFVRSGSDLVGSEFGFNMEDFPVEKQRSQCSRVMDASTESETIPVYLKRTLLYRIPRMSVRWSRIGSLLK